MTEIWSACIACRISWVAGAPRPGVRPSVLPSLIVPYLKGFTLSDPRWKQRPFVLRLPCVPTTVAKPSLRQCVSGHVFKPSSGGPFRSPFGYSNSTRSLGNDRFNNCGGRRNFRDFRGTADRLSFRPVRGTTDRWELSERWYRRKTNIHNLWQCVDPVVNTVN